MSPPATTVRPAAYAPSMLTSRLLGTEPYRHTNAHVIPCESNQPAGGRFVADGRVKVCSSVIQPKQQALYARFPGVRQSRADPTGQRALFASPASSYLPESATSPRQTPWSPAKVGPLPHIHNGHSRIIYANTVRETWSTSDRSSALRLSKDPTAPPILRASGVEGSKARHSLASQPYFTTTAASTVTGEPNHFSTAGRGYPRGP